MEHIFHGSLPGSASSIAFLPRPPELIIRVSPRDTFTSNYVHQNRLARYWCLPVAYAKDVNVEMTRRDSRKKKKKIGAHRKEGNKKKFV